MSNASKVILRAARPDDAAAIADIRHLDYPAAGPDGQISVPSHRYAKLL